MPHRDVVTGMAQPDNDFRSVGCGVGARRHDRLMPILRPAQRTSVDWLTGELVQWQSEGWLEAQHADQLLRAQRGARRSVVDTLLADLVTGLLTCADRRRSRPRGARASAQPPATAGMTEICVPSGVAVSRLSRNLTSSLPT